MFCLLGSLYMGSSNYIWQIKTGKGDNPDDTVLAAI